MNSKLDAMAVVINSETKLTYEDYALLPEDGKIHEIIGPPDLIIEILSESTGRKDRELKRGLYQKAKVPEYWLVDPEGQQVTMYRLKGGSYETAGSFHDEVRYEAVEGVVVDLSRVW